MLYVGIDFGKRIGIAKAYEELKIAVPIGVYYFNDMVQVIKKLNPDKLIIGWPLLINGSEGLQCHRTKSMIGNLMHQLPTPIEYYLQDERFSSQYSNGDDSSAAWILKMFLEKNK